MKQHKLLAFLLLIILLPIGSQAIVADQHTRRVISDLDTYARRSMNKWKIPGIAYAVVKGDKIIHINTIGVREKGKSTRINNDTLFRICSLSKGMTASLVGTLVKEKKLSWDTKIKNYIPSMQLSNNKDTHLLSLKHILSHTSGLPKYTHDLIVESKAKKSKILDQLKFIETECKVGRCYSYQNVMFNLAGDIIDKISSRGFDGELTRRIFRPLKMRNSSTTAKAFIEYKNKAIPHMRKGFNYNPSYKDLVSTYYKVASAGGVNSTISDMAKWLKFQMNGHDQILNKKELEILHTSRISSPEEVKRFDSTWRVKRLKKAGYGLGWRIYNYAGQKLVYHGGVLNGFSTLIGFMPKHNMGIVILTNSNSPVSGNLMAKFFDQTLRLPEIDYNHIEYKKFVEKEKSKKIKPKNL